jgi:hypothetical protein
MIKDRKPSLDLPVPPHRGRTASQDREMTAIFLKTHIFFIQIISLLQISGKKF